MIAVSMVAMSSIAPLRAQAPRDSAGILIVDNARPAWTAAQQLSLAAKPRLSIGDNKDTANRFLRVEGAMRLADGRIVAVDVALKRLRIFDAQGRILSSEGSGPWQVPGVHWVRRLRGDTIAVRTGFASVMLFSNDGKFVRTVHLPPDKGSKPGKEYFLYEVFTSTLGVAAQGADPVPALPGTRFVDSIAPKLVTDSGTNTRELGTFPYLVFEQQANGVNTVFLAPTGVFAASDDRFYAGFGDQYAIRVYTSEGKLQSIIRRAWKPVPITDDDWEHWVTASTDRQVRMAGPERVEQLAHWRQYPRAKELPAYSQFIVDRAGRLWVREAHWQDAIASAYLNGTPTVPSKWSVFDTRGRWLGDVTMPSGFRPFEIGSNYVIGSVRADGVLQVVVYDLGVKSR